MHPQPLKQPLIPLKQLFNGIQQQAFTKAPGSGEEVVFALFDQLFNRWGFVHLVEAFLADLGQALDTYGEFAFGHGVWLCCWVLSLL